MILNFENFILENKTVESILGKSYVKGGRANNTFTNARKKLEKLGYKEIYFKDSTHPANDSVNRTFKYEKDGEVITLSLYLGDTAQDNSFSYSQGKAEIITKIDIKNDKDLESLLSEIDYKEIFDNYKTMSVEDRKIIKGKLFAISNYMSTNNKLKEFKNKGLALLDDSKFEKIISERGFIIKKKYLGNPNNIQVYIPFDNRRYVDLIIDTILDLELIVDGRIGYAYIKLNDKDDVEYLINQLSKVPPIF